MADGGCSHLCLQRPAGEYTCACPLGLELRADARTCVQPDSFLVFTRAADIRLLSLRHSGAATAPIPLGAGVRQATALDFHIADNRIYWSDVSLKVGLKVTWSVGQSSSRSRRRCLSEFDDRKNRSLFLDNRQLVIERLFCCWTVVRAIKLFSVAASKTLVTYLVTSKNSELRHVRFGFDVTLTNFVP